MSFPNFGSMTTLLRIGWRSGRRRSTQAHVGKCAAQEPPGNKSGAGCPSREIGGIFPCRATPGPIRIPQIGSHQGLLAPQTRTRGLRPDAAGWRKSCRSRFVLKFHARTAFSRMRLRGAGDRHRSRWWRLHAGSGVSRRLSHWSTISHPRSTIFHLRSRAA